ncbi:aminoglycoside 2'-N-acetyltransferase [Streptomyces sp. NL15-2K]|uniref:aminoglycoside 2'-N-acetyltransferase n=1 Tax=Streptomyces sp. NL15-2K TaxID=376149 RepID=UPI000FF9B724|nr:MULTISPECIES: aminoglycoside 2'-N-acetyltransferase [Actinomycetes]WKX12890.1 hypothetical protein Q4V64_37330 [Kutzneria buriramensis]GCB45802.1 aminoglycoside 2'-N-acetyltransferase aac [Streptomyces sp. NL15-2K]
MTSPTGTLRTAHTADLTRAELQAVRALLDTAFDGDFTDEDFDHGLGGMHALIHDRHGLAAHGSVVMRRVRYRGRGACPADQVAGNRRRLVGAGERGLVRPAARRRRESTRWGSPRSSEAESGGVGDRRQRGRWACQAPRLRHDPPDRP